MNKSLERIIQNGCKFQPSSKDESDFFQDFFQKNGIFWACENKYIYQDRAYKYLYIEVDRPGKVVMRHGSDTAIFENQPYWQVTYQDILDMSRVDELVDWEQVDKFKEEVLKTYYV